LKSKQAIIIIIMGATPQQEIDRQHKQAMDIVHNQTCATSSIHIPTASQNDNANVVTVTTCPCESQCPLSVCSAMTIKPEIPLTWKLIPTVKDPYYEFKSGSEYESVTSTRTCSDNNSSMHNDDNDDNNNNEEEKKIEKEKEERRYCIATRGVLNVEDIASIIYEGSQLSTAKSNKATKNKDIPSPTNLWSPYNAKKYNVHITRPSHDAWGIQKIILIFCDDFLQNIYEMPYFHLPKYQHLRNAIQPIIDVLNIDTNRIVRMLFASLPNGVTIPIHHDTGEWVKHTHRVHVPIIVDNPDHILFLCGPSNDIHSLERVNCKPGHVFEMNNQAKHTVSNCSTNSNNRVHLILDYVDEHFHIKNRIQLSPGEVMHQSRRSIDRAIDVGTNVIPYYMILGAQKSGTTSLYEYINQHPLVIRPTRRETHCFDWRWDNTLQNVQKEKDYVLNYFHGNDLYRYPSLVTGDSTPSYLLDSYRVIPRIKRVFGMGSAGSAGDAGSANNSSGGEKGKEVPTWKKMKFIVMVRNPTKRAHSHYEMVTSLDGTEAQIKARGTEWLNKSFEQVINDDFINMNECGLIPYWDMERQEVDMDIFESFVGSQEENDAFVLYLKKFVKMNTGSHSIIVRGMYELQLRQWVNEFERDQFLVIKLESMSSNCNSESGSGVDGVMTKVWNHLNLPQYKIQDEEAKNTRAYRTELDQETKEVLDRFYKPHNKRVAIFLFNEKRDSADKELVKDENNNEWINGVNEIYGDPW
jgi:hypothetical protein